MGSVLIRMIAYAYPPASLSQSVAPDPIGDQDDEQGHWACLTRFLPWPTQRVTEFWRYRWAKGIYTAGFETR